MNVPLTFGIILSFVTGMFLVAHGNDRWMLWPVLFSFVCIASMHTVPALQAAKAKAEEDDKKDSKLMKWTKVLGPYIAATLLSLVASGIVNFWAHINNEASGDYTEMPAWEEDWEEAESQDP